MGIGGEQISQQKSAENNASRHAEAMHAESLLKETKPSDQDTERAEKRQELITKGGQLEAARKNKELAARSMQGPLAEKFQKMFDDSSKKISELEEEVPRLQANYDTLVDKLFDDANKGPADRLN